MKTIKHIITLTAAALIATTAAAQERGFTSEQKAQMEAKLKNGFEKLNLTAEQKPKFEEITKRYGNQLIGLKQSNKGRLAKLKMYKSIQKNKDNEMRSLLSIDQYKAYEKAQEELRQKMRQKSKG